MTDFRKGDRRNRNITFQFMPHIVVNKNAHGLWG